MMTEWKIVKRKSVVFLFLLAFGFFALASGQQRLMEDLDRGLVAVDRGSDIYLSWRMLGTEPASIGFNVYRDGSKINSEPITESTNYTDTDGSGSSNYYVTSVNDGTESEPSRTVGVWSDIYKTINLNRPSRGPQGGTYEPNDLSVGDLDGDRQYEIIVKWYPSNAKDNSQSGHTDNTLLEAVELDGTSLWRIDLGVNIRSGAHYTQFMVYDLDSDGKAEVACKTAPGTRDGTESYLSDGPASDDDDGADYRNGSGYILDGPEYLTVFNGETGAEMATVEYIPVRGNDIDGIWGDGYGNRVDRFLACIAYLDGESPSLVMCRGYYTRAVLAAWDWDGENLNHRWTFDSYESGNGDYSGQGAHSLAVGDADGDGADEIMYGACAIDNDGTGLYSTGYGHGDATHLGDLDPDREGLEFFMPHEGGTWGYSLRDAGTGEMIMDRRDNGDVGRGVAADVCSGYRGAEFWASGQGTYNVQEGSVNIDPSSTNFLAYWDGDVYRELLNGTSIDNMNASGNTNRLLSAHDYGAASVNGTKSNPGLCADILGDWREEGIWKHQDNDKLLVFTTDIETDVKNYTLMHDPVYRLSVAWQNVAYNQPTHVGYYFPDGAPRPNITLVNAEPVEDCAGVLGGNAYIDNCGECVRGTTGKEPCEQDCNGDWGGDAYLDECDICVGGETGLDPCTGSIEGEGASSYEGVIESDNTGYTGDGYLNYTNETGVSATWSICSNSSLTSDIMIRYSNGSGSERNLTISVNGTEQIAELTIPATSSWTTWETVSAELDFQEGENLVSMTALSEEGGPNIDIIIFSDEDVYNCETGIKTGDKTLLRTKEIEYAKGKLSFYLQQESDVDISIYNISGQKLKTLFKGRSGQGYNSIQFNTSEFTSGMYIFVLKTGNKVMKKRVLGL